jgi:FxLD family lantipeptide
MSAALAVEPAESPDTAIEDSDFELDLRVVVATTPLAIVMCQTNDGCGSTCATSACSTASNDPY